MPRGWSSKQPTNRKSPPSRYLVLVLGLSISLSCNVNISLSRGSRWCSLLWRLRPPESFSHLVLLLVLLSIFPFSFFVFSVFTFFCCFVLLLFFFCIIFLCFLLISLDTVVLDGRKGWGVMWNVVALGYWLIVSVCQVSCLYIGNAILIVGYLQCQDGIIF